MKELLLEFLIIYLLQRLTINEKILANLNENSCKSWEESYKIHIHIEANNNSNNPLPPALIQDQKNQAVLCNVACNVMFRKPKIIDGHKHGGF